MHFDDCWHVLHENCQRMIEREFELEKLSAEFKKKGLLENCSICKVNLIFDDILRDYYNQAP